METLTLDTNILRDWAWCLGKSPESRYRQNPDEKRRELQPLFEDLQVLRDREICEIGVTTQLYTDYDGKSLDDIPQYIKELIGPYVSIMVPIDFFDFALSFSVTFHDQKEFDKLFHDVFPDSKRTHKKYLRNQRDTWQLYAHRMANRDVFLTEDKGILIRSNVLVAHFNIQVKSLSEYIKQYTEVLRGA